MRRALKALGYLIAFAVVLVCAGLCVMFAAAILSFTPGWLDIGIVAVFFWFICYTLFTSPNDDTGL